MLKSRIVAAIAGSLLWVGGAAAQDTIKVGANLPMSGPNAELGEIFSRAASIAVNHINADKMLSKKLELAIEDSQATPQGGVVAMNKLVSVTKVPYVLSAYTAVSKAIAPIGDRAKVVSINGGAVGPDLAELGDYFWNVIPLVNFEAEVLIPFVVKEKGLKNIVLIFVDDPLGEAVQKVLREQVPKAGGKLVGELQVQRATQQFASIAANVRQLKPDAIYIASFGTQVNQIIKQLRDNGITQQLMSYSAMSTPSIAELPEAKGAWYTTQSADFTTSDLGKRVAKEYKELSGKDANAYVANYYNAIMVFGILAQQLEKAGKPITGTNLLEQRRASPTFELIGGKMTFQQNGTVAAPVQIRKSTAPARASSSSSRGAARVSRHGVSSALRERAAARRDLRADCSRFLADLRLDENLPRRARLGVRDQRLHLLVARLEARRAVADRDARGGCRRGGIRPVDGALHLPADPAP